MVTVARLRTALVALMLLVGPTGGMAAQPPWSPEATDALPAGEGRTYLDLLRLVMPGIAVSGARYSGGRQPPGIRNLEGLDEGDVGLAPAGLLRLAAMPVRSGGKDRLALLVDFGETEYSIGFAVLALFDIEGEPQLLDAADIAYGRWTSFADPVLLSVGADDDVLVTQGGHHNSSQGYASTSLIHVRNDRFELVDTISMLSERDCAFERGQSLAIRQGTGKPRADIVATVTERTTLTAEDCNGRAHPEPGSRTITVTYRWDSTTQRYAPDSDAFAVLARENEERF